MTDLHDRRAEDKQTEAKLQAELDALVAAENDPSKRATLMVLNAINRSLTQNTAVTHTVKEQLTSLNVDFEAHVKGFAKHAKDEEALLNKGRGAWMALAWFLGIVQVAVGMMIMDTRDTLRVLQSASIEAKMSDQRLNSRIDVLEAKR
jgi:hypothetical protein